MVLLVLRCLGCLCGFGLLSGFQFASWVIVFWVYCIGIYCALGLLILR